MSNYVTFSGSPAVIIQNSSRAKLRFCPSFSPPAGKLPFVSAPTHSGGGISMHLTQEVNSLVLHDHLVHGPSYQHGSLCREKQVLKHVRLTLLVAYDAAPQRFTVQKQGAHRTPLVLQDHCPSLQPYLCPHKRTCQHRFSWCERSSVFPHASEKKQHSDSSRD